MPKKLEDCVSDVKAQGHPESNAYAICVHSTGLSPHEKSEPCKKCMMEKADAKNVQEMEQIMKSLDMEKRNALNESLMCLIGTSIDGVNYTHSHECLVDQDGSGYTVTCDSGPEHVHEIKFWQVLPAGEFNHNHRINPHSLEIINPDTFPPLGEEEVIEKSAGPGYCETSIDGVDATHSHEAKVSEEGKGETTSTSQGPEHTHQIKNWQVSPAGEYNHTHRINKLSYIPMHPDINIVGEEKINKSLEVEIRDDEITVRES